MTSARVKTILPLTIDNLGLDRCGHTLLDGISCTLERAGRSVVLGPNGAGKSLFLRVCHGLLQPSRGIVHWADADAAQARPKPHAMVFQNPILLRRTALANVAYALRINGFGRSQSLDAAWDSLVTFGLERLADRPARSLSGGEQQKLALARAWVTRPEMLFLDEPTSNLDPAATRAIEEMVAAFDDAGTKVVMTTHDLGQARRLADEVLFFASGRLLEKSTAEAFFVAPACREAMAFLRGDLLW